MNRYQKFKSQLIPPEARFHDEDWWPGDWWEETIFPQISELINSFDPVDWEALYEELAFYPEYLQERILYVANHEDHAKNFLKVGLILIKSQSHSVFCSALSCIRVCLENTILLPDEELSIRKEIESLQTFDLSSNASKAAVLDKLKA